MADDRRLKTETEGLGSWTELFGLGHHCSEHLADSRAFLQQNSYLPVGDVIARGSCIQPMLHFRLFAVRIC